MPEQQPIRPDAPLLPPAYLPPPAPVVAADGSRRFDGATYAAVSGYRPLLLDIHLPPRGPEPVPVVLWIHGGGWAEGDRRYPPPTFPAELLFGAFLAVGLAVVSPDYRHSLEAPFPAQLHDVRAALRYVRHFAADLGLDPGRIGLFGESAGAHLAVLAALAPATSPAGLDLEGDAGVTGTVDGGLRAVVDWYGPVEIVTAAAAFPEALCHPPVGNPLHALLGGSPADRPEIAAAANAIDYADHPVPPFLIIHGTADQVVPYHQSELLAERLRPHTEVELVTVPGADHIFIGAPDPRALLDRTVSFLAHHLKGDGDGGSAGFVGQL
ncbi:alpha/beta hydrolase fold domain-containing protein [Kitasatospora sp. McL0602]|uniref:alpha/beta hydrolase fold domain-containing protein n=1 Tax=Kitasatospora sp. McL0602 TaxID=3439530 RepID=UPI003F8940EA